MGADYTVMCPFDMWVQMLDAIQDPTVEFAISFHWVSRAMARQQPGMSNPNMLQSEPKFHDLHLLDADKKLALAVSSRVIGTRNSSRCVCCSYASRALDKRVEMRGHSMIWLLARDSPRYRILSTRFGTGRLVQGTAGDQQLLLRCRTDAHPRVGCPTHRCRGTCI